MGNKRKWSVVAVMGAGLLLLWPAAGQAQIRSGGTTSLTSPRISPYMQYFRHDKTPLDNYHQFVRPEMELRAQLNQGQQDVQALQRSSQKTINLLEQQEKTSVRSTGRGGAFLNYMHYYPQSTPTPRR